jgi:cytochrome c
MNQPSRFVAIAAALAIIHTAQSASANAQLADEKQCLKCHQMDKDTIGPSMRAIADRYSNRPEAFDMLVSRVKTGGWGHWGDMMMPPRSEYLTPSDDEAAELVRWILKQR